MKYYVGISGWRYAGWKGKGSFYPPKLPEEKWLEFYATHFSTVELNNTFYFLPQRKQFLKWKKQTSNNFLFSVKGSRYITHIKRLKDAEEPLQRLFSNISALDKKCGPILFQLPPNFKKDETRLEVFLKLLPKKHRCAIEFRNPEWFTPSLYKLLEKYRVAFCIFELGKLRSPRVATTDFLYIRLHGRKPSYKGNYSAKILSDWKKWIDSQKCREAYVYFDNTDEKNYATKNAQQMLQLTKP